MFQYVVSLTHSVQVSVVIRSFLVIFVLIQSCYKTEKFVFNRFFLRDPEGGSSIEIYSFDLSLIN